MHNSFMKFNRKAPVNTFCDSYMETVNFLDHSIISILDGVQFGKTVQVN
jgi:hypothetical protein